MLKDLKPIILALVRFFIVLLGLVFLYQLYLNHFAKDSIDPLSRFIATQATYLLNKTGYNALLIDVKHIKEMYFYINGFVATRMVEGCNAISVMIFFVAFVFTFYKGSVTFVFVGIGLIFLYIINVFRIYIFNIVVVEQPQYTKIMHDYVFPLIIYGAVVILWLVWIKFFAMKHEKS